VLNETRFQEVWGTGDIRGPFEKFVDLRQCTAVTQREGVTVMPSCGGGVT